MYMFDQIYKFLGQVIVYGGGAAAFAYLIFQYLGKSWIENKFKQKLEQYKHEQALEIQRLKIEIDSVLSGTLKLQEKEFETLPEAWRLLDEAYGRVASLVSHLQQYPDLDQMSVPQIEEFLSRSELLEFQKEDIRQADVKLNKYQEIIFWHRLATAQKACSNLENYIVRYGIFFPEELKEQFSKVIGELWSTLISKEIGEKVNDVKMQNEALTEVKEHIEPLRKSIENNIHARLRAHGVTK